MKKQRIIKKIRWDIQYRYPGGEWRNRNIPYTKLRHAKTMLAKWQKNKPHMEHRIIRIELLITQQLRWITTRVEENRSAIK